MGLKPIWLKGLVVAALLPQSNQRGIETAGRSNPTTEEAIGLNRTSVGLKQRIQTLRARIAERLNRTSVGLKPLAAYLLAESLPGLNRTSVGLKRFAAVAASGLGPASIEPAWD